MKIAVVGMGYIGLSLATLLSQKIDMINNRISSIKDNYIEKFFKNKTLNLKTTLDYKEAFNRAKNML